jgi:hypothetical protein
MKAQMTKSGFGSCEGKIGSPVTMEGKLDGGFQSLFEATVKLSYLSTHDGSLGGSG